MALDKMSFGKMTWHQKSSLLSAFLVYANFYHS